MRRRRRNRQVSSAPAPALRAPSGSPLELVVRILEGEGIEPLRARAVAESIVLGIAGLGSEMIRKRAEQLAEAERTELAGLIDAEAEAADAEREGRLGRPSYSVDAGETWAEMGPS